MWKGALTVAFLLVLALLATASPKNTDGDMVTCSWFRSENHCDSSMEVNLRYESRCHWCSFHAQPHPECVNDARAAWASRQPGFNCTGMPPPVYCSSASSEQSCLALSESWSGWSSPCFWCYAPQDPSMIMCGNRIAKQYLEYQGGFNCSTSNTHS